MEKEPKQEKIPKKKSILWITRTGILLALLLVFQAVTKPMGTIVTGSLVNLVLSVAALYGGLFCGIVVAFVSPFFAFLLGIQALPFPLIPAIAVGNLVLAVALYVIIHPKKKVGLVTRYGAAVVASGIKTLVLWVLIPVIILPLLGLPEQQTTVLSATFSISQLPTALIGSCIAVTILPILRKSGKA